MPVEYLSQSVEPIDTGLSVVEKLWRAADGRLKKAYRARIYQRSSQTYHHKTLLCDNFLDAKRLAIEYFQQFKSGSVNGEMRLPHSMSLRHCIERFIEMQRVAMRQGRIQEPRFEVLKKHIKTLEHFSHAIGRPKLDVFIERYLERFDAWQSAQVSAHTGRPFAKTSRDAEVKSHRQFFRWLQLQGVLTDPVTFHVQAAPQTLRPFPQDHHERLIAAAHQDVETARTDRDYWNRQMWFVVMMTLYELGCRVSELRALKWSDVSPVNGEFSVSLIHRHRRRGCMLTEPAAQRLLGWKNFKFNHGEVGDFVFTPWQQSIAFARVSQTLKNRWFRQAGVIDPETWTFSCFRHSFLINALSQGADPEQIASYCGLSADTLKARYANTMKDQSLAQQSVQPMRLTFNLEKSKALVSDP